VSSIDERLESLLQSTESLYATVLEHSQRIMKQDRQIDALIRLADRNERRWYRIMRVVRDAIDTELKENE